MRGLTASVLFLVLSMTALSGCLGGNDEAPPPDVAPDLARDDAVVIAVVDGGFDPYHWDFLAAHMPQHQDDVTHNDLPLDTDPADWLIGHPGAAAFASYTRLDLTINATDKDAVPADLHTADKDQWEKVKTSTASEIHMNWIPGTKVVGFVTFGGGDGFSANAHGVGTTSVSVGNLHGTCPECLLVFVDGSSETANEWVERQDWIDLQTNSWGLSLLMRDRMYAKSDTALQLEAIERGQSIFFSAGNGQANAFVVPNPTLWSSQEGPDWIITVGAITPDDGASYTGHGKPADIASVGSAYPSAGGQNVSADSTFGGTSNATPVTAGIYGRALHLLRREMAGASRVQANGTVAIGDLPCGDMVPTCATGDGALTVHELRAALFHAARYTSEEWNAGGSAPVPIVTDEQRYLSEGHGSYWGRIHPTDDWWNESRRIADFARGESTEVEDSEQLEWMIADSFCRQTLWGLWEHGYYQEGTSLPASDPVGHPLRTWFTDECPRSGKSIHTLVSIVNG